MTPLPPGFAATAADDHLAVTIGLEAHGFLLWLMRQAGPTSLPAGGWAVMRATEDIAREVNMGKDKVTRLMRELRTWGLIITEPGRRLGRGFGSTTPRHFLATNESMVLPGGAHHRDPDFRHPYEQHPETPTPQRHLTPVRGTYKAAKPATVMMNDDEQSSRERKTPPLPASVTAALKKCGWTGPPPTSDTPPDVIAAIANWVAGLERIGNKGAYVRKILSTPGEATMLAASLGLVTVSGSVGDFVDRIGVSGLSPQEYWDRAYADPEWRIAVETEAARRAGIAGGKVSLGLLREVGAELA